MRVLTIFATALVAISQAAPVSNQDPNNTEKMLDELLDGVQQEGSVSVADFKKMSLDSRLSLYSKHIIYRPEATVGCINRCIDETPGYPIHNATYGSMCKTKESMAEFDNWLNVKVGACMERQRQAGQVFGGISPNGNMTPCVQAFDWFMDKTLTWCDYIRQESTSDNDIKPLDNWV